MSKKMLINMGILGEIRVAVVDGEILEDISMEGSGADQIKGNVYAGSVAHVDSNLEAVFVDYGTEKHGFVPFHEIPPFYFGDSTTSKRGGKPKARLKKGMKLLLQVGREPIREKGASLTGYISLPGRYLVIMPYSSGGGISRKIADPKERDRLKNLTKDLEVPENFGLIIRTAGLSVSLDELKKDYANLIEKWDSIQQDYEKNKRQRLVYAELDLVNRTVRDYFSKDIQEVLVDCKERYLSLQAFFKKNLPDFVSILKLYQGKTPLLTKYGVEEQMERIFSRVVPLSMGGSIVIDSTEALVAIDVNSGKGKGCSHEEMTFEINKAAAVEAARQLRLRDLGGLVVIDFIDMRSAQNRGKIKAIIQEELKKEKARVSVGSISKFGLMELSRQRVKKSPFLENSIACPTCGGYGVVRKAEFLASRLLEKIANIATKIPPGSCIKGVGGKEVVEFLTNEKRNELQKLELDSCVSIFLYSDPDVNPGQEHVIAPSIKEEKSKTSEKAKQSDVKATEQKERGKPRPRTRRVASKKIEKPQEPGKPETEKVESEKEKGFLAQKWKGVKKQLTDTFLKGPEQPAEGEPPKAKAGESVPATEKPLREKSAVENEGELKKVAPVEMEQSTPENPKPLAKSKRPRKRYYRKKPTKKEPVEQNAKQEEKPGPAVNTGDEIPF